MGIFIGLVYQFLAGVVGVSIVAVGVTSIFLSFREVGLESGFMLFIGFAAIALGVLGLADTFIVVERDDE